MAGATREETFDIPAKQFYNALLDYEHYPKILSEVDSIDVLEKDEHQAKIQYNIHIVKKISYTLKMTHDRPRRVAWDLHAGSLFKKNSGEWLIEDLGDKCKVTYSVDVALKVFAPKAITSKLVSVSLPRMMNAFYEHARNM
ncbi:type II toxin-antitoxin system RatA family toxin [Pseudobacteriovorax antillogorgiicola]|uniref:Polyketide cyclase / dehydrase and lipid transport n=1 Tax=Pseudobacteriovorax antillogorgiicola TaxID=1513793 RepID=A0A1Y6CMD5_9BACT|nr:SRPBCC family protein [Pseudobacteriovorax antillogorgiicola]TCS44994.1 polyketide cyclase/dehydrase/lipid transport protein [Pseudobacteriovorax antillogorgiicola]SMF76591.1 Polyketide cyclase / dehydrase and lipid transport [Pseudobacteriovorax antillogorgiicola]